jgi:hypothetical protein
MKIALQPLTIAAALFVTSGCSQYDDDPISSAIAAGLIALAGVVTLLAGA